MSELIAKGHQRVELILIRCGQKGHQGFGLIPIQFEPSHSNAFPKPNLRANGANYQVKLDSRDHLACSCSYIQNLGEQERPIILLILLARFSGFWGTDRSLYGPTTWQRSGGNLDYNYLSRLSHWPQMTTRLGPLVICSAMWVSEPSY